MRMKRHNRRNRRTSSDSRDDFSVDSNLLRVGPRYSRRIYLHNRESVMQPSPALLLLTVDRYRSIRVNGDGIATLLGTFKDPPLDRSSESNINTYRRRR